MAAAVIFAKKMGLRKADLPSAWIEKSKKTAKIDSKAIADVFLHPKPNYRATMSAKSAWNACTALKIFYPRPVSEALMRV